MRSYLLAATALFFNFAICTNFSLDATAPAAVNAAQEVNRFMSADLEADVAPCGRPDRYIGYPHEIGCWTARYFRPEEFAPGGNGFIDIDAELVSRLDAVRSELGLPIVIAREYRGPVYDAHVGRAKNRQRPHGTAVDIDVSRMDAATRHRLVMLLIRYGFTGFGSYDSSPDILHASLRAEVVTWDRGGGMRSTWFVGALKGLGWTRGSAAGKAMAKMELNPRPGAEPETSKGSGTLSLSMATPLDKPLRVEGTVKISF